MAIWLATYFFCIRPMRSGGCAMGGSQQDRELARQIVDLREEVRALRAEDSLESGRVPTTGWNRRPGTEAAIVPGSAVAEEGRWAIRASDAHREAGHARRRSRPAQRRRCPVLLPQPAAGHAPVLALSGAAPIPSSALGATGVDVLARATRLAPTPTRSTDPDQLMLAAVSALLVVGPLLTVLLTATGVATR